MGTINPRLELRLEGVRSALSDLAGVVDDNLRSVLPRMTAEEAVAAGAGLRDAAAPSQAVMDACGALLGLQGPVARDLRWAMGMIRIGKDYERVQNLTAVLFRRVETLRGTLVEEVLEGMTDAMRQVLALHAVLLELWEQPPRDVCIAHARLHDARRRFGIALADAEDRAVEAMVRGEESAENLRELVLACRHLKRIASTLASMPGELLAV